MITRQLHSVHFRSFFLAVALCVLQGTSVRAVTLQDGPAVQASASTATVTWSTDVVCGTRLSFGTDAQALTQKAQGALSDTHTVTLSGLLPGTTYYYAVGSARVRLGTGSFTTTTTNSSSSGPATGGLRKMLSTIIGKRPAAATPATAPAVARTAPPTRMTWGSLDSLRDHFDRHGGDFNATSPDDYAAQAWLFLQRARQEPLPMKWDESDDTLRVWDPRSHTFAAYSRTGRTRTFFKPGSPGYWDRQPGRSIKPADLPF